MQICRMYLCEDKGGIFCNPQNTIKCRKLSISDEGPIKMGLPLVFFHLKCVSDFWNRVQCLGKCYARVHCKFGVCHGVRVDLTFEVLLGVLKTSVEPVEGILQGTVF